MPTANRAAERRSPSATDRCETTTVPEAGRRYYGMSRNASYAAAARGDIPTVRVGRLLRVPIRAMERKLDEAS
jgi:ribosomal protein S14